ncbi:TQO small subunit DoxD [Mucilaginibacter sp.]|uniref:TQO small subunit DoxD n=1 Tax=Mucilaginibacter sp. TaxID=1882438 RepID=UPI0035BC5EB9
MKTTLKFAQLFLRLSLGIGFLFPAADRFGWLGPAGQFNVDWGNWQNFVTYTHVLLPFLNPSATSVMGGLATLAEVIFGIQFLIGYQTRLAALGSFLLTLIFALCMAIFMGIKAPFNYSVFTDSAAALLLATVPVYYFSLDNYLNKKAINNTL